MKGRLGIITGASAGIGRAFSDRLMHAGMNLVVNARRSEPLGVLEAEWNTETLPRVKGVAGDAADEATIDEMFRVAREAFGQCPDTVIVNAGRGLAGSVVTSDLSQFEDLLRVNLLGATRLLQRAAREMITDLDRRPFPQIARDIVVLGSTVGRHISPFSAVYGSTKFGVNSLAEALRREVGPKGIRVTLIEPAIVKSEFQQVAGYDDEWARNVTEKFGPVLEPDDVARTVEFILAQPPHVHLSDVVIRPVRQDYP